ncbi:MAG: DUF5309 family protein [Patescibacteria group bacterium]|nr:DUF5309 family protein [Patescibacteria group bacterium]
MALYDRGIQTPYVSVNAGIVPEAVFGVGINWFINRTPLLSRLPAFPVGSPSFNIENINYRPRSMALSASYTTGSDTTISFTDASWLTEGDVLTIESENFLVTSAHATTPTVTGAYAGSTGANHASAKVAYLVGNTRTGGEVDVNAIARIPVVVEQYVQTVQHAVQVGGALQATSNWVGSDGRTPLDQDRMLAIQHCMDDFEESSYYGVGVKVAASTTRPMMKGLKTLIATNNTTSPTNAGAYKPSDLMRDTIQACTTGGGNPTLMLVSMDFQTGLAVWGQPLVRLDAGATELGVRIDMFEAPFLDGITVVPAPLLKSGTAICLSGMGGDMIEVRQRLRRQLFEKRRGSRGDAIESDFIMDGAIELDNEAHHAWVEGITAFAAA